VSSLTVVLPTLNEAGNIGPLIASLKNTLADATPAFLVIDGNSRDETAREAAGAGATVITDANGYCSALMRGMREATTEWVLVLDADGSHRADDARKLWDARHDADLVVGSRMTRDGGSSGAAYRRALSRVLAGLFASFARLPARDVSSGFRLYRRAMFADAQPVARFFEVQPTLLAHAVKQGGRVKEVGIYYHPRDKGRSKNRVLRFGVAFLGCLWRIRRDLRRSRPL
jgi:dolichol-phosphate mannosyltransferase